LWIDALKVIPGVAKAISNLVIGASEAGVAWVDVIKAKGEQVAQSHRDETLARSTFMKRISEAASEVAVRDPAVVARAIVHLTSRLESEQATREEIAYLALRNLQADPPPDDMTETPDDDWLNLFSSLAARASSQAMKEHWAQILKGQIR
jgi:hypothetical protein